MRAPQRMGRPASAVRGAWAGASGAQVKCLRAQHKPGSRGQAGHTHVATPIQLLQSGQPSRVCPALWVTAPGLTCNHTGWRVSRWLMCVWPLFPNPLMKPSPPHCPAFKQSPPAIPALGASVKKRRHGDEDMYYMHVSVLRLQGPGGDSQAGDPAAARGWREQPGTP